MSKKVMLYQLYAESQNNKILCYFSTQEEADRVFYAVSDYGYLHDIFGKKQKKQKYFEAGELKKIKVNESDLNAYLIYETAEQFAKDFTDFAEIFPSNSNGFNV